MWPDALALKGVERLGSGHRRLASCWLGQCLGGAFLRTALQLEEGVGLSTMGRSEQVSAGTLHRRLGEVGGRGGKARPIQRSGDRQ